MVIVHHNIPDRYSKLGKQWREHRGHDHRSSPKDSARPDSAAVVALRRKWQRVFAHQFG